MNLSAAHMEVSEVIGGFASSHPILVGFFPKKKEQPATKGYPHGELVVPPYDSPKKYRGLIWFYTG